MSRCEEIIKKISEQDAPPPIPKDAQGGNDSDGEEKAQAKVNAIVKDMDAMRKKEGIETGEPTKFKDPADQKKWDALVAKLDAARDELDKFDDA